MGSIGAFVEITVIFALVCASAMMCIIQAGTVKPTYNIYVVDLDPKSRSLSSFDVESMLQKSGDRPEDAPFHLSGAEFEDSDLSLDMLYDSQLRTLDDADSSHGGNLSVLCWLATETTYTQDSDHTMLEWSAPCYREMQQSEDPREISEKSECHFEVSNTVAATKLATGVDDVSVAGDRHRSPLF
ncbi:hypothetical protein AXG93_4905s1400 [Marchantia polymorpha subsp. ruderalis]|uniref:Uncharacterized protein n=1 Tax=Marchantia polymorpha subsp. ruderalis TaxID=1480154 RepID=A0A176VHU0_MARPO|nr:hypothetical protein AXG93_4905s1400 [Marchantia polymorpha subsp. ruderalis]